MGKSYHSDEHLVMKSDGWVVRARPVREMGQAVTLEKLSKLKSEPHAPTGIMKTIESILRTEWTYTTSKMTT